MTNTVYFHNTIRDDFSTTTEEEETPPTSNRYTHQQQDVASDSTKIFSLNSIDWTPREGRILEYSNSKEFSFNDGALGEGFNGRVFKDWIDENNLTATQPEKGIAVAIKRLQHRGYRYFPQLRKVLLSLSTTTEEEEIPSSSNRYTHDVASDEGGILEYSNSKEFTFNQLKRATSNFRYDNILGEGGFRNVFWGWVDELEKDENQLEKLENATRYFHHDDILGEEGFGRVFKGWIDENKLTATNPGEGIAVAIKRRNQRSFQAQREWRAEVNYLGRLYHPNLLRLLGYCSHNEERLLVYEFMPRGSLGNHLFTKASTPLSWSVRMKIALGAAKGLAFLHSAPINVIHRGFKSSNILLDMDYNAKLADFGLAMDGPTGDETHVDTRVMGTYGYVAPEYVATGHLTSKCDVYTFGVVLLEMLCGQRVMDKNRPSGKHNLVDWAKPYLNDKRKVSRVADRRLEGQYSLKGFQKAANLALICLSQNGESRPNMDEVVKVLGEL